MEKTLSQDEIDVLFQAARAKRTATAAEDRVRVQPYSFARAGQISNEQMRAISLLNDMFARNVTHNLGAWLRSTLQVSLVSAEQMAFSDYTLRIPELSYVCSVRLEPLRAIAVMQMDLAPAPAMIDLLLGGEGAPGELRELTDIEESILSSVAEAICRELTAAWQQVGLTFHFEQRQMQTQIARLMPVSEKTLCLSFELRIPSAGGLLNLVLPAVVSNTILHRLVGDWTRPRRHAPETRQRILDRVGRSKTGAALQLPPTRVPAREIESLVPGSVLRLKLPAHQAAELRVSGVPLFAASPVSCGDYRGAHLAAFLD